MTTTRRTRREALQIIGAGAAGAWGWPAIADQILATVRHLKGAPARVG